MGCHGLHCIINNKTTARMLTYHNNRQQHSEPPCAHTGVHPNQLLQQQWSIEARFCLAASAQVSRRHHLLARRLPNPSHMPHTSHRY